MLAKGHISYKNNINLNMAKTIIKIISRYFAQNIVIEDLPQLFKSEMTKKAGNSNLIHPTKQVSLIYGFLCPHLISYIRD